MQGGEERHICNRREEKFCKRGNKGLGTSVCPKQTFISTQCWGLQDQDYLSSASKSFKSKLGGSTKSTEYTALEGAPTLPGRLKCPSCHRRVLERHKSRFYSLRVYLEKEHKRSPRTWGFRLFSSVPSLSRVWLSATPWTAACQASLSITNSRSLPKLMSIGMPSKHLILCRPLLLPSFFPSIRVFSDESVLRIRWPRILEFQLQHQPFQRIFRTDFL